MGGFSDLAEKFQQHFKVLESDLNSAIPGGKTQAVFRVLYLATLFEINGNLDTIALCSRAIVEQLEKIAVLEEKAAERSEQTFALNSETLELLKKNAEITRGTLLGMADFLTHPPVEVIPDPPEDPKAGRFYRKKNKPD